MKNILLPVALLFLLSPAFAQDVDPAATFQLPRNIIKLAPLKFFVSTFELGLESFNTSYTKSFNVSAGLRSGAYDYADNAFGANLELEYRKYVAPMKYRARGHRESYQGIYYGLFVRGEYFEGDNIYYYDYANSIKYSEKIYTLVPGFTIGYQKTLWQIILLDVFVGGGVKLNTIEYSPEKPDSEMYYDLFDPAYSGVFPKIGAKIGIGLK